MAASIGPSRSAAGRCNARSAPPSASDRASSRAQRTLAIHCRERCLPARRGDAERALPCAAEVTRISEPRLLRQRLEADIGTLEHRLRDLEAQFAAKFSDREARGGAKRSG